MCPVPTASVLKIHHVNAVSRHRTAALLEPQIVSAAQALFEDLWSHDRRTDGQDHAPVQRLHRSGEGSKILGGRPTNHRAVEHRMAGNDVIPDPGMHRHRHTQPPRLSQQTGMLPGMRHRVVTGGQPMPGHGRKQFATSPGHWIGRKLAHHLRQGFRIRQIASVFVDKLAQGLPIAQSLQSSGHQGQVDVPTGFIPRSEGSRGDIFLDPFCGASQPRVFPVMDGPSSVRGQVLNETALHQACEQGHRPIANQVGPIHQDHRGSGFPGCADGFHHFAHGVGLSRRQRSWRLFR